MTAFSPSSLDTAPSGRLVARLVLPTRLPTGPTERAAEADGDGPVEELCHGWKLGLPA